MIIILLCMFIDNFAYDWIDNKQNWLATLPLHMCVG